MCLRSAPASVSCGAGRAEVTRGVSVVRGTCKTGPGERITARSMTFCSLRILPGQAYRIKPCMVSEAMVSMVLCIRRAHGCTRWRISRKTGARAPSRRPRRLDSPSTGGIKLAPPLGTFLLSLSRLSHRLPRGQAHPEVVQGAAEFHHQITNALLPQTNAIFQDATALHTAVDVLDP